MKNASPEMAVGIKVTFHYLVKTSYDTWLEKIKAWKLTMPIEKKTLIIALALPERSKVHHSVFEESSAITQLNTEDEVIIDSILINGTKKDNLFAA